MSELHKRPIQLHAQSSSVITVSSWAEHAGTMWPPKDNKKFPTPVLRLNIRIDTTAFRMLTQEATYRCTRTRELLPPIYPRRPQSRRSLRDIRHVEPRFRTKRVIPSDQKVRGSQPKHSTGTMSQWLSPPRTVSMRKTQDPELRWNRNAYTTQEVDMSLMKQRNKKDIYRPSSICRQNEPLPNWRQ